MTTELSPAEETIWLSAEQQVIWRKFLGGTTVLMDRLDRDLRELHGIAMSEYEILVRLSEAPERSIRMAELAEAVSHSRSRITHAISRLERGGLVERIQCSDDGRGVTAVMTKSGFALLEKAAHTHVRGVRSHLVENASPEEFEALGRIMGRILDDLNGSSF